MNCLKPVILGCFLVLTALVGAPWAQHYNYPIEDPYAATIVGTPTGLEAELLETIPSKEKKMTIFKDRTVPDVLWYQDSFRYSLAGQKKKAPLIFIIAGTGAAHNSSNMKMLENVFFKAGFHVVCLSSPTHPNFIATASKSRIPGISKEDAKDIYHVMERVWQKTKDKIEVTKFYLTGYSLGGVDSAFVAKLDEDRQIFNFEKVLMINPPVSLYRSVGILDDMLEKNIPGGVDNFNAFYEDAMKRFSSFYKHHAFLDFNSDFLYALYKDNHPEEWRMAATIGLSFRISSANMLFTTDVLNRFGYIVPSNLKLSASDSLTDYAKVTFRQSFVDYVDELILPFMRKSRPNMTKEQLVFETGLNGIEDYLAGTQKIGLVMNSDDLILGPKDVDYLKDVFKDRVKVYPKGGHCGNMLYRDNVAYMIKFFNN